MWVFRFVFGFGVGVSNEEAGEKSAFGKIDFVEKLGRFVWLNHPGDGKTWVVKFYRRAIDPVVGVGFIREGSEVESFVGFSAGVASHYDINCSPSLR